MSKNLMDHVLMNKLDDEIGSAIEQVGGDISGVKGPWDYAEIIKDQLCVKGGNGSIPSMDIKLGPGLKIEEVNGEKYILATSAALTTCSLNPPTGSYMQPIGEVIEAGTPIQKVLESLFYEILPKMPSLFKGDIIRADKTGADKYNEEDIKSGLVPNSVYLRLYITSRQEPVYILLSGHGLVNSESGSVNPGTPSQPNEYIGGDSEYIHVDVVDNIITASLTQAGLNRFSSIESELNKKASNDDLNDLMDIVNAQTQSINSINDKLSNIDLSGLDEINEKISNIQSDLNTKASKDELDELKETVNGIDTTNFATKAELDELKETVEGIDTTNFATKAELESVEGSVAIIQSDLDTKASKAELDELKETVNGIDTTNFATKTELESVEGSVAIIQSDLNTKASKDELDELKEIVNGIDTTNFATKTELEALQETVNGIDTTNFATKTELESVEGSVAIIQSDYSKVQSDLNTKASKTELDELKETVNGIDTTNFATKTELESVEGSVAIIQSDYSKVQSDFDKIEENLKDVNVSELNNTVEVLKTEVVTKEDVSIIVEESVNEVIQTIEIEPDPISEDRLNEILV